MNSPLASNTEFGAGGGAPASTRALAVVLPYEDFRDVGLCHAESLGDFSLGHGAKEESDFSDFGFTQEFLEVRDEAHVDGVLLIQVIAHPFEIGGDAISLDAVDVINHRHVVRVGDESKSDKAVDVNGLVFAVKPQINLLVSDLICARSKNLPVAYSSAVQADVHAVNAANSTEVADLVRVTEVIKVNRSPFFGDGSIHVTGCPSEQRIGNQEPVARSNVRRVRYYGSTLHHFQ